MSVDIRDLRKREAELRAQLDRDRKAYGESADAAANADPNAPALLAELRARISTTEGELTDLRATIEAAERAERTKSNAASREQCRAALQAAIASVRQRQELAKELQAQIASLGKAYVQFVQAGITARQHFRSATISKSDYENFDAALGGQERVDQCLTGLLHLAGLGSGIVQHGPVWAGVMREGPSFSDLQTRSAKRAIDVATNQLTKVAA